MEAQIQETKHSTQRGKKEREKMVKSLFKLFYVWRMAAAPCVYRWNDYPYLLFK
jgi:hypothetical protein